MRVFPGSSVAAAALLFVAFIGALGIGPAAAQPGPGEEQISVRIIARNADNDRVELGLIADGQSADNPILPSARFMSWATVDAADVTDWRYSSAVTVGDGERGATVRIAARGRDRDRIEFILQQRGADGEWSDLPAPQARFFSRATTHTRWLHSSPLQVAPPRAPADPPTDGQSEGPVAVVIEQAPAIDAVSCEPASPVVGGTVTCSAELSGGEPDSYAWGGGGDPASGADASFSTTFDSTGDQTISLTVANSFGEATDSTTFSVEEAPPDEPLQAPVIDAVSCEPASPAVGGTVTCSAELSGGEPGTYAWSGGGEPAAGTDASFSTTFDSVGDQTISLTVANTAGDDTQSATVAVVAARAPVIDAVSCEPDPPVVGETVTCSAELSGSDPDTYAWSGGGDPAASADASFSTTFDSVGARTISLTVANSLGDDTLSTTVDVLELPPPAPSIDSLSCSAQLDGVVRCSAVVDNDGPSVSYAWSGGGDPASGSNAEFVTSFATVGDRTISLTVSNSGGSASDSTSVAVEQVVQASAIDSISCSPAAPEVGETVTCSASLGGGEPDFYTWRGGGDPPGGNDASFSTSFASPGARTISLAVSNIVGEDSASTTVAVQGALREPVLDGISCSPSLPTVGQAVTCSASLSGGPPDTYSWSGDGQPAAGSDANFTTTFASAGNQTVTLSVANEYGSSITLTFTIVVLEPLQAPVINSVSCSPASPTVGETVTCTGVVSGGEPSSYAWTGGVYATAVARGETYTTSFNSAGSHTVQFTVQNTAGRDTQSTTVAVAEAPAE